MDFPTENAFQPNRGGAALDGFVAKIVDEEAEEGDDQDDDDGGSNCFITVAAGGTGIASIFKCRAGDMVESVVLSNNSASEPTKCPPEVQR